MDIGTNKQTARLAGALYLCVAIGSGFAFIALGQLVVPGDAAATLKNIAGNETIFRSAMVGDVLGQLAFALLAPVLYALFRTVDRVHAALLAILVLVPVPIALASVARGAVAVIVPACMVVATVAELAMVGWLLVFGIKTGAAKGASSVAGTKRECEMSAT